MALPEGVDPESPFLLGGEPAGGARPCDAPLLAASFDPVPNAWVGPFVMEPVNARVVRRSSALLGYGPEFRYREVALANSEKQARKLERAATSPAPPEVVKQLIAAGRLPKPGEGPTPEVRARSRFVAVVVAEAAGMSTTCTVAGGEAGYEETAKMVTEAALALATQCARCPGHRSGGVHTAASAMGHVLIERLHRAGIRFDVAGPNKAAAAAAVAAASTPVAAKL